MVMITLYAKQKKRHRYTEQSFGLCGRRRENMFLENSMETCILSMVKQITSPGRMHEISKCSSLVHWEDPEGSGGEGGRRVDRDGEYMYIHG